ncbi:hypothetical protein KIN20_002203 [Parelaphostrongylus tenuis]|uniref:Uncharacterized protein n=1 Tax=Parelaphostrongylus tenuis TaxID=148309 RepID=A0AAD5QGK8_PARTN|nr:hypothetical protein KIN20_002203 [Parelaphostrongylus tenuis]
MNRMELKGDKEKALLSWFNTYGTSINLAVVDSLTSLWSDHLPSLLNCLRTDDNKRITAPDALSSYQDLFSHFLKASVQDEIISSLSVEKATDGDRLEIAKFLAVLLNEFRLLKPEVITESVAVMQRDGHDVPLKEILSAFDGDQNDWWSSMVKPSEFFSPPRSNQTVEEFSAMSVTRSSFLTPCPPNRRRKNSVNTDVHTVTRCGGSPLLDAINSPKVRELRREREIRTLRKQIHELEDRLANSELQVLESQNKIESLVGEIASKNERIRNIDSNAKVSQKIQDELEARVAVLNKQMEEYQRHFFSQKEWLRAYKRNVEELEERQVHLDEQIEGKNRSISVLERQLLDAKDEAEANLQQAKIIDNERKTLMGLLEEERKAVALEREQYQKAVADWRKRLETETTNSMTLYTNEMEKNAAHQQEIREKTEQLEKIRLLYDSEKQSHENAIEEIKKHSQDKYDALTKRLAETEEKLSHQEERYKSTVNEHESALHQLESVHMAEIIQRDTKIGTACARIEELEIIVIERDRIIREQRKDLANTAREKDVIESTLDSLQIVFKEKEDQLKEATMMIERLKEDLESVTRKFNNINCSLEILQAECSQLQSAINSKNAEIFDHVEGLKLLSKAHDQALNELKQTKESLKEQRKLFESQDFETKAIIEGLKEKLEVLEDRNSRHADSISLLEGELKSVDSLEKNTEELFNRMCKQLREKFTLRGDDLLSLMMKFEILETELFVALERNSKLQHEVTILKEENALLYVQTELLTSKKDPCQPSFQASMKSIPEAEIPIDNPSHTSTGQIPSHTSVGQIPSQASTVQIPSHVSVENSESLGNEDDHTFFVIRTSHSKVMELENRSAVNTKALCVFNGTQPSQQQGTPSIASKPNSVVSLAQSSTYSTASAPKSNNSKLSLVESHVSEAKDVTFETDQSRVSELQRRNAMLHPAMRCAYAAEVVGYNSPSGSENVIKHGSHSSRRRSGIKFLQRASSYVRRKLPLSDSTNSLQKPT